MKALILILATYSVSSFAAEVNTTSMSHPEVSIPADEKLNFTEVGAEVSAINNGTSFASLSLAREMGDWFTGGIRALLPINSARETQVFLGQVFGRFPMLNDVNQIYIEARLSLGVADGAVTAAGMSNSLYAMGASYCYRHHFSSNLTAGADLGADMFGQTLSHNEIVSGAPLESHFSLVGGYYF
jgi:hypothetical protein